MISPASSDDEVQCLGGTWAGAIDLQIAFGLKPVTRLSIVGGRCQINGDGNCGFRGNQKGIIECGVNCPTSVAEYRKQIRDFIEEKSKQEPPLRDLLKSVYGTPLEMSLDPSSTSKSFQTLDNIWKDGVNYDKNGASFSDWFDPNTVMPIESLRHQLTFMVYTTGKITTQLWHYDHSSGRVVYACGPDGTYYTPVPNAVCLVYDGAVHFDYLKLHKRFVVTNSAAAKVEVRTLSVGDKVKIRFNSDEVESSVLTIAGVNPQDSENPLTFVEDAELSPLQIELNFSKVNSDLKCITEWGCLSTYSLLTGARASQLSRKSKTGDNKEVVNSGSKRSQDAVEGKSEKDGKKNKADTSLTFGESHDLAVKQGLIQLPSFTSSPRPRTPDGSNNFHNTEQGSETSKGKGDPPSTGSNTNDPKRNLAMQFSSPVKRVLTRQGRGRDSPYFICEETDEVSGKLFCKYKKVEDIRVPISVTKVRELVDVTMVGEKVVQCNFKPEVCKSIWFNSVLDQFFPKHFAPTHRNSKCHTVPKEGEKRRGRKPPLGLIVHFCGMCEMHSHGCPTEFFGGLQKGALAVVGARSSDTVIFILSFTTGCRHKKDKDFGRLSGSARKTEKSEFQKSGLTAGEFVLKNTKKIDPEKSAASNLSGKAMKQQQCYEMKRELRRDGIQFTGIGTDALSSIPDTIKAIKSRDKQSRHDSGDDSIDCLGIVRRNDALDVWTTFLWGKNSLVILSELAKESRLVLHVDSSKLGKFGLHNSDIHKKLLFTRVSIQPGDSFIRKNDRELFYRQFFKGLVLAEMISNQNKTLNVSSFFSQLASDCLESTRVPLLPELVHTDMAGQLLNGVIDALRKPGQVTNQIMHANVCLQIYLRLAEKMVAEFADTGDWLGSAKWALQLERVYSPCSFHYCDSHQIRAVTDWAENVKDRTNDAPEVITHSKQFGPLLKTLADNLRSFNDVSMAITTICASIAILSWEKVPCNDFTLTSDTQSEYDDSLATQLAESMLSTLKAKASEISITSDAQLGVVLEELMKLNEKKSKQFFMGKELSKEIIESMKENLSLSMTTLRSIDREKKTGVVDVWIIHSPFPTLQVLKWSVSVSLPHRGGDGLKNVLFSETTRNYLIKEYLCRVALRVRTPVSLIDKVRQMPMKANNQHSEGMFKNDKCNSNTLRMDTSQQALYFWKCYNNLMQGSSLLVFQTQSCENYIDDRRSRLMKKREIKKGAIASEDGATEDAKEMETLDNENMVWDRSGSTAVEEMEEELRLKLLDAITAAGLQRDSMKKWRDDIVTVSKNSGGGGLFSQPTFNKWLDRKPVKKLCTEHINVMKTYIKFQKERAEQRASGEAQEKEVDGKDQAQK